MIACVPKCMFLDPGTKLARSKDQDVHYTYIYIHTSADLCISNVEQMKSFFKLSLCSRKQTRHGVLIRLSLFQGWLFEPLFYYKRGVSRDGVVLCRVVL